MHTQRGDWYDANCPAHTDLKPSFSFTDAPDGLLVFCHAGCTFEEIAAALREAFPRETFAFAKRQTRQKRQIVATYDYRDKDGVLLYQSVRYHPKDFRFRRPDGKGGWIDNLDATPRVLYRLPDLKDRRDIFITEGEKDADTLWNVNLPATTNPGGAGKWTDDYAAQLKAQGATVALVLPDNDRVGKEHAHRVALSCLRAGLSVAVLELPGLPEKGDVSDWLKLGHTANDLLDRITESVLLTEPRPDESEGDERASTGSALADRLVALAGTAGVDLFHTPQGEPFIIIPATDHDEVHPLSGGATRAWLSRIAWTKEGKAAKPDILASAIQTLVAQAQFDGPEEPVHLRTAWHEGALYYDVGDPRWRVIKITPDGWEGVDQSPVRFVRHAGMAAQTFPERGGNFDDLWRFVNIPEAHHRRLLEAWLVAALIPDIPRPALGGVRRSRRRQNDNG